MLLSALGLRKVGKREPKEHQKNRKSLHFQTFGEPAELLLKEFKTVSKEFIRIFVPQNVTLNTDDQKYGKR